MTLWKPQFQLHFSLSNENADNKVFTGSSSTDSHGKVRQNTEFQSSEYFIMLCHIETHCSIFNTAKDNIESRYKRTLSSPPVFSEVRITRSLVLYVCFVDRCLSFSPFYFGHCVVCSSSIYGFWLPLWYLQILLITNRCGLETSESYLFMCILYIYTMGDTSVTGTAYPWEVY